MIKIRSDNLHNKISSFSNVIIKIDMAKIYSFRLGYPTRNLDQLGGEGEGEDLALVAVIVRYD